MSVTAVTRVLAKNSSGYTAYKGLECDANVISVVDLTETFYVRA